MKKKKKKGSISSFREVPQVVHLGTLVSQSSATVCFSAAPLSPVPPLSMPAVYGTELKGGLASRYNVKAQVSAAHRRNEMAGLKYSMPFSTPGLCLLCDYGNESTLIIPTVLSTLVHSTCVSPTATKPA